MKLNFVQRMDQCSFLPICHIISSYIGAGRSIGYTLTMTNVAEVATGLRVERALVVNAALINDGRVKHTPGPDVLLPASWLY